MPGLPLTGRCQCGAAAYSVSAVPEAVYVCHCRECQKQSASAFGISVSVAKAQFHSSAARSAPGRAGPTAAGSCIATSVPCAARGCGTRGRAGTF